MKNISIWKDTVLKKEYPKLEKDINIDVLIIGGGITGISTFYHLKKSNLKIALVEQNKIGFSITGNSTGKLNYLQNDLLDKIRFNFNDEVALKYIRSQKDAIELAIKIINDENIDCDIKKVDSFLYTNKDDEIKKIKDLEKFLSKNNIITKSADTKLVNSKYMFKVEDTYIFHPIKFIYGLIDKNDNIYENTGIKKIEKKKNKYVCFTDNNKIIAKHIIIASHYPYFNLPFLFPIKGSLEKSYLSASIYDDSPISLISYSKPIISLRSYKDYLIYLSNSHIISNKINDKENFFELKEKLKKINLKPDYLWSNIDIMTNDGLPYIGKIKENMFIATGYNTWGLTNGILAGKIISDMILNKKNQYIELFNPNRINMPKVLSVAGDAYDSIKGYIKSYLNKSDKILYKKIDGKSIMEYKEGNKKVYHTCPHLGCKLLFNEIEETFDCPCHGSRFDINGKCISAPANKDINIENK